MSKIPENRLYLLAPETRAFAYLATTMADQSPQVTPVWFLAKDGHIFINTAQGRVKDKNMQARKRVAIAIADPEDPYTYIHLKAVVVERYEDENMIHQLAEIYWGRPDFHIAQGEIRVTYKLALEGDSSQDW